MLTSDDFSHDFIYLNVKTLYTDGATGEEGVGVP